MEIARDPTDAWNWGALGADAACAFLPFVAGGGMAMRGARAVNAIDDVSDAVKAADRTHDYARTIGGAWDVTARADDGNRWVEVGRRGGRSLEHQSAMSGQMIRRSGGRNLINEFRYHGVYFDDFKGGTLFDYKGDYSKFIGSNGKFKGWFSGGRSLTRQAVRQVRAANGIPVVWRVGEGQVTAFSKVIKRISGLTVVP
ncbi:MAG: Tox-REase-5 domain-containing protein [Dehalococcoidia bacterium]|nr:Tox-REase-5 domain-containing protein [Dehalococcoidia bacterium]